MEWPGRYTTIDAMYGVLCLLLWWQGREWGEMAETERKFEDLKGDTLTAAEKTVDEYGDDRLAFTTADGRKYALLHLDDCCERVWIADIVGDLGDLVGTPILMAYEATSNSMDVPESLCDQDFYQDTMTWTFYHLATINGYVTIRWVGSSNGYYSEAVDFVEVTDGTTT